MTVKSPRLGVVKAKCVVVKACFAIKILPGEPQVLLDIINRKPFHRPPGAINSLPNDLAVAIRQLQRRTNLVCMEIVELLPFPFRLVNSRQWRIATRLIHVKSAVPGGLLSQHPQPLPEEALLLDFTVDLSLLGHSPPQAVIAILAFTFELSIDQCLSTYQAIFAVVTEALQLAVPRALLDQVAPWVVAVLLIPPTV